jgi:hypothetical protein
MMVGFFGLFLRCTVSQVIRKYERETYVQQTLVQARGSREFVLISRFHVSGLL